MYTFNYNDTLATRDAPPPQACRSDFIIVPACPYYSYSSYSVPCDALLNLFACKFTKPFPSRIPSELPIPAVTMLTGIIAIARVFSSNYSNVYDENNF